MFDPSANHLATNFFVSWSESFSAPCHRLLLTKLTIDTRNCGAGVRPDSTVDGARLLLMAAAALLRDRGAFLEDARIAWGVMVGNREDHG